MTINDIFLKEEMSVRAFNTCTDNEIETISELKEYYNTFGSFTKFRNCGRKTDEELINLCLNYVDFETEQLDLIDIYNNSSIIDILAEFDESTLIKVDSFIRFQLFQLSRRSSNALMKMLKGDITLKNIEINIFKNIYFNISKISDIGEKSIPEIGDFIFELKTFIIKISDYSTKNKRQELTNKKNDNSTFNIIENLDRRQRQIVNSQISILTENLTVRSNNAISSFLQVKPNLISLKENIFSNSLFNFTSIRNIGARSIPELSDYLNKIENFIKDVNKIKAENELSSMQVEFLLRSRFTNFDKTFLINEYSSIFNLIKMIIENNCILNETDTFIFTKTFNLYSHSSFVNLKEIAEKLQLTKERVRQKRVLIFENTNSYFEFLKDFDKKLLLKYKIDLDCKSIIINDEYADFINAVDVTNFSKQFLSFFLYNFLSSEFSMIGNVEDVLLLKESNSKDRHIWQNIYLLKNEVIEYFDFNKFIEDINSRKNERNDEAYKFNFKSYLSRFFKGNSFSNLEELIPICEKIISEEFNLFLSIDEEIIFERNTFKTLPEYAYEALEILGKPSHISEINEQIKILKPDYQNEIANTALSRKHGIISFSKTSTFGLKKWENERDGIKGGSIKKMAYEYLKNKEQPTHLLEIMEEVSKYRSTSLKSILQIIKSDPERAFIVYNQNFIGLKMFAGSYDVEKYNNIPFQLGKKIIGYKSRGILTNEDSLIKFLFDEYQLTKAESIYIKNFLSITNPKLFNDKLNEC